MPYSFKEIKQAKRILKNQQAEKCLDVFKYRFDEIQ
jgi:hypothetical protein